MNTKTFSSVSLVVFGLQLMLPSIATAALCRVSALDTVAGLGTEVQITGCDSGLKTTLSVLGPNSEPYTQAIVLDVSGNATTLIPSKNTVVAGRYNFTVAGQDGSFTVLGDRADETRSKVVTSRTSMKADGKDSVTVTATLHDRYDNPVAGRKLALIASRLADDVSEESSTTDESGRFLWTLRSTQAGTATLTVYDVTGGRPLKLKTDIKVGTVSTSKLSASLVGIGGDATASITPNDTNAVDMFIDHFEIDPPHGSLDVKANELFSLTIRAMRGTELVRGYVGSLDVTTSDTDADLPREGEDSKNPKKGRIDMRDFDQGARTVSLAFLLRSSGKQTIEVFDRQNPAITGIITLNVTSDGATSNGDIVIMDPPDRSTVTAGPILLQGHAPSLINLEVIGGATRVKGETDSEGVFRISVPLNPQDKEATLFVRSENGTYESNPVHIIIDTTKAAIETITIDPTETKATDTATITVKSEIGLKSVTAVTGNQTIDLVDDTGTGIYKGTLKAPETVGIYDVTITATDSVDNATTMLTKWTVVMKTMPIVQGLTAESQSDGVLLKWQAIESAPVREYKVYIAADSEPTNQLYSIATGKAVTSAIIKDLPPNRSYRFTLTALYEDGSESPEKSQPAIASVLGMELKAVPGADSLLLQWTPIPGIPLDHYELVFGKEPGVYTEKRTINGQANSFMLRDLIGGNWYELKLIPVDVTGKVRDEFESITSGTPEGAGFVAGTNDPVPPDMIVHSGAPQEPDLTHIPTNVGSGLGTTMLIVIAFIALISGLFWRHAAAERRVTRAFLLSMQQRYHAS